LLLPRQQVVDRDVRILAAAEDADVAGELRAGHESVGFDGGEVSS
jgi:hypothetical protein